MQQSCTVMCVSVCLSVYMYETEACFEPLKCCILQHLCAVICSAHVMNVTGCKIYTDVCIYIYTIKGCILNSQIMTNVIFMFTSAFL